ncbi:MAG: hypothetical protein FWE65_00615, partial [Eggerthellaceae bacterium]|nr:hypothetical protein [Eggerthellaceae bacterium]
MLSKKFRKSNLLAMLVLSFVLSLVSTQAAFADEGAIEGSEEFPAQSAITKLLQMPEGTDLPTADFQFKVESISVDDVAATTSNMPIIGDADSTQAFGIVTISYTAQDVTLGKTANNTTLVPKESESLFAKTDWKHAGVYVYRISELTGSYKPNTTPPPTEVMSYSKASYQVNVYVTEGEKGLYVYAVGAMVKTEDNKGQDEGKKVDSTPGGGTKFEYSQMTFTNTYVKIWGGDIKDPSLALSKAVAGELASKEAYFRFDVNVTAPLLVFNPAVDEKDATPVYLAYVVEDRAGQPTVVTSAANGNVAGKDQNNKEYLAFTSGEMNTVNLKHGQRLVFIDTPVGSTYTVSEIDPTGYV